MRDKKPVQKQKETFRVGDKIVDFGRVYRIFEIKKKKGPKGKKEEFICYRHYYKTPINKNLSYSIPIANIAKTNLRKPISKKELGRLFKELAKKSTAGKTIGIAKAKTVLNLNQPSKTARVLKSLWLEKNDETVNFSKTKQDVFGLAMKRLVEEVALVSGISLAEAKEKIYQALEKVIS